MVNESLIDINALKEALVEGLGSSLGPLITIFKAVGIALLIYLIFLILKALFRWRTMSKVSKISKHVSEINDKLDIIVKKGQYIDNTHSTKTSEKKEVVKVSDIEKSGIAKEAKITKTKKKKKREK